MRFSALVRGDLGNEIEYFIYYTSPHAQDSARLFQKMELDTDARNRDLMAGIDRKEL